ncbi:MAG: hypothetical protein EVA89_12620 [Sandaracinaceae bacterium]|nr:MAG: hypothetical protein EVA89_12620 [Sandaracinaceae bacterium]
MERAISRDGETRVRAEVIDATVVELGPQGAPGLHTEVVFRRIESPHTRYVAVVPGGIGETRARLRSDHPLLEVGDIVSLTIDAEGSVGILRPHPHAAGTVALDSTTAGDR